MVLQLFAPAHPTRQHLVNLHLALDHVAKLRQHESLVDDIHEVFTLLLFLRDDRLCGKLVEDDGHEQVAQNAVGQEIVAEEEKRRTIAVRALAPPLVHAPLAIPVRRAEDGLPVSREYDEQGEHCVWPGPEVGVLVDSVGCAIRLAHVAVQGNTQARVHEHEDEEQHPNVAHSWDGAEDGVQQGAKLFQPLHHLEETKEAKGAQHYDEAVVARDGQLEQANRHDQKVEAVPRIVQVVFRGHRHYHDHYLGAVYYLERDGRDEVELIHPCWLVCVHHHEHDAIEADDAEHHGLERRVCGHLDAAGGECIVHRARRPVGSRQRLLLGEQHGLVHGLRPMGIQRKQPLVLGRLGVLIHQGGNEHVCPEKARQHGHHHEVHRAGQVIIVDWVFVPAHGVNTGVHDFLPVVCGRRDEHHD
mmetsp:Transcript_10564/g.25894  ORF Transcript_10564/g.25894 Transcript_10564/m.25894 type:complete len:415 (-) Transcript_10564:4085-5329(-)